MANKFFKNIVKYDTLFSVLANVITVIVFMLKVSENNKSFSDYAMLIWLVLLSILFMVLLRGTNSIKKETSIISLTINEEKRKNQILDKYNTYAIKYLNTTWHRTWQGGSAHVYIFHLWKYFTEDELKELVILGKITAEQMHEGYQYKDFE